VNIPPYPASSGDWGTVTYQLTTQSHTGLVFPNDKSFIAGGQLLVSKDTNNDIQLWTTEADALDLSIPAGYLVGVDTIYLGIGGDCGSGDFADEPRVDLLIQMEATSMTASKAMALSLSQQ